MSQPKYIVKMQIQRWMRPDGTISGIEADLSPPSAPGIWEVHSTDVSFDSLFQVTLDDEKARCRVALLTTVWKLVTPAAEPAPRFTATEGLNLDHLDALGEWTVQQSPGWVAMRWYEEDGVHSEHLPCVVALYAVSGELTGYLKNETSRMGYRLRGTTETLTRLGQPFVRLAWSSPAAFSSPVLRDERSCLVPLALLKYAYRTLKPGMVSPPGPEADAQDMPPGSSVEEPALSPSVNQDHLDALGDWNVDQLPGWVRLRWREPECVHNVTLPIVVVLDAVSPTGLTASLKEEVRQFGYRLGTIKQTMTRLGQPFIEVSWSPPGSDQEQLRLVPLALLIHLYRTLKPGMASPRRWDYIEAPSPEALEQLDPWIISQAPDEAAMQMTRFEWSGDDVVIVPTMLALAGAMRPDQRTAMVHSSLSAKIPGWAIVPAETSGWLGLHWAGQVQYVPGVLLRQFAATYVDTEPQEGTTA